MYGFCYEIEERDTYGNGRLLIRTSAHKEVDLIGYSWNKELGKDYFSLDSLGSVTMITGNNGETTDLYDYDVFGSALTGDLATSNRYGYNGKAIDPVTGLYDYGFRDYSTFQMRFSTVDPIKDGLNWYGYVGNDPVNYIDLFGLDTTIIHSRSGHTSLHIKNDEFEVLYDPAGGYRHEVGSDGDIIYGKDADLDSFIQFKNNTQGETVVAYSYGTTLEDEKEIESRLGYSCNEVGSGGFCTTNVGNAIRGVGPFEKIDSNVIRNPWGFTVTLTLKTDGYSKQLYKPCDKQENN